MMKRIARIAACLLVTLAACSAAGADPFGGRHVLIIGIDGCRVDALRAARAPNIKSLANTGSAWFNAYTGGEKGTKTQQPTTSAPGWSSVLTGVWADKHHVTDNTFARANFTKLVNGRNCGYPHLFTRIKEKMPKCYLASIVQWGDINDKLVSGADLLTSCSDGNVARQCAALLTGPKNPAVIFLHFAGVDGAGHANSYGPDSPDYMKAIENADARVGAVLHAMRKRPDFARENWLVLVTTDHGGRLNTHGKQTPEERTVFIIANGGGFHKKIDPTPCGLVAIPPTVCRHLGIQTDPSWGWESKALEK